MSEKNLLPKNKKMRKKNQIFEYHAPSPRKNNEDDTKAMS